ncbi:hypothetical protein BUALT_Bualt02G0207600 [Buddleja alternifolia]|uniref:Pectinesterase inhibitor domain-containing protein n=1 Tax=Buddleja alternifolia TaxID=168488 RepID=A0AAV6Y346_9LAMI|nr:hypothetical protein BUALT_Bualt02G0207600 [Buddleja alternifolia]
MAYSVHGIMFFAFLFAFAIPFSLCHIEDSDNETTLRDLCSQIERSSECIDIIKSKLSRFENSGCNDVTGPVMDLAREKAEQIRDMFKGLHEDSNDDNLKEKYLSCSSNYNDVSRDLDVAKKSFDSNDYQNIHEQMDDIVEELESCREVFNKSAFYPTHVRDRNIEYEVYADLLKVTVDHLIRGNESEDGNYNDGSYEYDHGS